MSPRLARPPLEIGATSRHFLGMPAARFLRDIWQKRPLLIRGAFPGFVPPLTPEDLAGLACEETALARLVQHDRGHDRWSVRSGPFRERDFTTLPARDWTVLVQDVDKWDADVAALLPRFEFLPRWRIDDVMVSYAAPGGSVGAHLDQYDVFLLQGLGRRRWEIEFAEPARARVSPPASSDAARFRDDTELKLLREFHPTHAWMLEPGDMLYLPPGVPHHGVAENACLTFSVGMRAPSQAELLLDFAEQLAESLPESVRYADPDLTPARTAGEIDAASLARVRRALPWLGSASNASAFDDDMLRRCFGRFITRYRSAGGVVAPPRPPGAARLAAALAAGARLVRHPFARLAWARVGRRAELFADGDAFECGQVLARTLNADAGLDAAQWEQLSAPERDLLRRLVSRGTLLLTSPPRRR